jgi:hypothetical protein
MFYFVPGIEKLLAYLMDFVAAGREYVKYHLDITSGGRKLP